MTPETFNEFWAHLCKLNPKLRDSCILRISVHKFREILHSTFLYGTRIPIELARETAKAELRKPHTTGTDVPCDLTNYHNGLDGMAELLSRNADDDTMDRAEKVHFILQELGIHPGIMFECKSFAETIISFILGQIPEEVFYKICKDQV